MQEEISMQEEMKGLSENMKRTEYEQTTDINMRLIFNMRDLNHIMRSLYEGKASQKRILIILNDVKSISQRDLTMRLGIQPSSASEILSKLENTGLIQRTVSETDRRTTNISLTEQGIQTAQEAAEQRSRRHVEMFSCLSESEKEELLLLLEKLNADWTRRYGGEAEKRRQRCRKHGHECEHVHDHGEGHEFTHGFHHGEGHGPAHGHEHKGEHGHVRHHEHGHGDKHNHDHVQRENSMEAEGTAHVVEVY